MPNWSAEFLLATLVVTSLATGGLLGLWAATSRWHWFARTMVVLVVLTPLLWRPIYEPFVTLLVEVAVVVLGVTVYRRNWPTWRFSVAGMLMITVVVAVLVAALMRASATHWVNWWYALQFGAVAGAVVLLATWLMVGYRTTRWKLIAAALAIPLGSILWYRSNYTDDFLSWFDPYGELDWSDLSATTACLSWAMLAVCLLGCLSSVVVASWQRPDSSKLRRMVTCLLGAAIAYPVYVAWRLSTPVPVPESPPTTSSAVLELRQLVEDPALKAVSSLDTGEVSDWVAMRQAVLAAQPQYSRMAKLLNEPLTIPVDYTDVELKGLELNSCLRKVARSWSYAATAARKSGDAGGAFAACTALLEFAHQLEGQGMLVNGLTASTFESMALAETYRARHTFDEAQKKSLARRLVEHNERRPSLDDMWQRERIFSENAYGWIGHFHSLFDCDTDLIGTTSTDAEYRRAIQGKAAAVSSLLAVELALRAYEDETDALPSDLAELVPTYLPSLPNSAGPDSVVYRRTPNGYLLYSRAVDGDLTLDARFEDED